jgi:hypothetical protein
MELARAATKQLMKRLKFPEQLSIYEAIVQGDTLSLQRAIDRGVWRYMTAADLGETYHFEYYHKNHTGNLILSSGVNVVGPTPLLLAIYMYGADRYRKGITYQQSHHTEVCVAMLLNARANVDGTEMHRPEWHHRRNGISSLII